MQAEAFSYMRQALGYPAPRLAVASSESPAAVVAGGDACIPGGSFVVGAR